MVSKSIEITINTDGSIKVEAIGYQGAECEAATRAIEEALGIQDGTRTMKPERFQQEQGQKEKARW